MGENIPDVLQKAIQWGFISMEQARACILQMENAQAQGQTVLPQAILLRMGLINIQQLQRLLSQESPSGTATLIQGKPLSPEYETHETVSETAIPESKQLRLGGLQPGVRIGPFVLERLIGQGGMGAVYLAEQFSPKRKVALKLMTKLSSVKDKIQVQRFLREVELTARLDHPNIVKAYLAGVEEDIPYLAMQYIEGEPVDRYLERIKPPMNDLLGIVLSIAEALDYAHQNGIIHRDIKPGNILVTWEGIPMLMDFGIAKSIRIYDKKLTRTAEILGTPRYMSPEQSTGQKLIDGKSDIYSLGVVLYEMLTRRPLYSGTTNLEILYQMASEVPILPRQIDPDIPEAVESIVVKCIEHKKEKRYPTASALAIDLKSFLEGKSVQAKENFGRTKLRWFLASHRRAILGCFLGLFLATVISLFFFKTSSDGPADGRKVPAFVSEQERMERELDQSPTAEKFEEYLRRMDRLGHYARCIDVSKKAIRWATPGGTDLVRHFELKLAHFLLKSGTYEESYALYKKIVERSKTAEAILGLAQSCFELKKFKEMSNLLDGIPENQVPSALTRSYFFHLGVSSLHKIVGSIPRYEYLQKIPLIHKRIELDKAMFFLVKAQPDLSPSQEGKAESLFSGKANLYKAYVCCWQGDWKKVEEFLAQVPLDLLPRYDRCIASEIRGFLSFHKKEYKKAQECFDECVELLPWESSYYFYRAESRLNQPDRSLHALMDDCFRSLEISPYNLSPIRILTEDILYHEEADQIMYSLILILEYVKTIMLYDGVNLWDFEEKEMAERYIQAFSSIAPQDIEKNKLERLIETVLKKNAGFDMLKEALAYQKEGIDILEKEKRRLPHLVPEIEKIISAVRAREKAHGPARMKACMAHYRVGRDTKERHKLVDGIETLKLFLYAPEEEILLRYWASETLAAIKTVEGYVVLEEGKQEFNKTGGKNDIATRILSYVALHHHGLNTDIGPLLRMGEQIKEEHPQVVAILLDHLGERFESSFLLPFTRHPNVKLKASAAKSLIRKGMREGISVLMELTANANEDIMIYAYRWLMDPVSLSRYPEVQEELLQRALLHKIERALSPETSLPIRRNVMACVEKMAKAELNENTQEQLSQKIPFFKDLLSKEPDEAVRFYVLMFLMNLGRIDIVLRHSENNQETIANRTVPWFRLFADQSRLSVFKQYGSGGGRAFIKSEANRELLNYFLNLKEVYQEFPKTMLGVFMITRGMLGYSKFIPSVWKHKFFIMPILYGLDGKDEEIQRISAYGSMGIDPHASLKPPMNKHLEDPTNSARAKGAMATTLLFFAHKEIGNGIEVAKNQEITKKLLNRYKDKRMGYAYYRFFESYEEHVDNRQLDMTTLWGRDQRYLAHLESVLNHRIRMWTDLSMEEIKRNIKNYGTRTMKAELEYFRLRYENAVPLAERVYEIYENGTLDLEKLYLIRKYCGMRAVAYGIKNLEDAQSLDPDNPRYVFEKAFALYVIGEYRKAKTEMERAIALEPERLIYRFALSRLLFQSGEIDEAENVLKNLESQKASGYSSVGLIGKISLARKEWRAAEKQFTQQHVISPHLPEPLIFRAYSRLSMDRLEEAQQDLQRANVLIQSEQEWVQMMYRRSERGADYFFNIPIYRAQGLLFFGKARLAAKLGNPTECVENLKQGWTIFEMAFQNYSHSPFTRENLKGHPEFQRILEDPFVRILPNRIAGFTPLE